ncbi:MAG TPA: HlyU family transcriptional regulator [Ferrovibrio sp.]|uniref:HlyU family transcriptional regulator n=1 Tax=Ferrovibrio sp. TaxID=1917215 RepID=UPI002ED3E9C6
MVSKLKTVWTRLVGGAGGQDDDGGDDAPAAEAFEYKGYRVRPAPYKANGQYQTAGIIEKDSAEGVKEHRFVRAETHPSKDDAAAFAIAKGKQIIDERGDRIFDER